MKSFFVVVIFLSSIQAFANWGAVEISRSKVDRLSCATYSLGSGPVLWASEGTEKLTLKPNSLVAINKYFKVSALGNQMGKGYIAMVGTTPGLHYVFYFTTGITQGTQSLFGSIITTTVFSPFLPVPTGVLPVGQVFCQLTLK